MGSREILSDGGTDWDRLIEEDFVVPFEWSLPESPERKLSLEVLQQAITDLLDRKPSVSTEARAWFEAGESQQHAFSYENVCALNRFEPTSLRTSIYARVAEKLRGERKSIIPRNTFASQRRHSVVEKRGRQRAA